MRLSLFAPVLFSDQLPGDKRVTRGCRFRAWITTRSVNIEISQGGFQCTDPLVLSSGYPDFQFASSDG